MVNLGDIVPNFTAPTTHGTINFHEAIEGSWAILFSHPKDYTPVCTTELGKFADRQAEFDSRGVRVFALSCDDVDSHCGWADDIAAAFGTKPSFPIIADPSREIAHLYGMLDAVAKCAEGIPLTCRAVFIIGPDKKLKLSILYPASTGRNFDEIIRVIDSLQITANHPIATPMDWSAGQDVIIQPSLSEEAAQQIFPGHRVVDLPSGKKYLRYTQAPSSS